MIDLTVQEEKPEEQQATEEETEEQKEQKEKMQEFFKKIVDHNLTMNGELKGVQVNGQEVQGIESYGWGSDAKLEVDQAKGTINKTAERQLTKPDRAYIA